ncbi:hypothetical protein AB0M87_04755 [Streptomyces sp. NPDC051320]|uniref:hypothetical protein n=1 Tax=Streptomyces sp. NPDC051320 TaxID=3154644 RepID=UPI00343133B9
MKHNPIPEKPPDLPRPASRELLALASAARPDWGPHEFLDVLTQARSSGMTWGGVLAAVGRLMADPQAEPMDLLPAVPEHWRRRRPAPAPETAQRGAAAARAALHTTTNTDESHT